MYYFVTYHDGKPNYFPHITKLLECVKMHGKQFEIVLFRKKDIDAEFLKNEAILSLNLQCKKKIENSEVI